MLTDYIGNDDFVSMILDTGPDGMWCRQQASDFSPVHLLWPATSPSTPSLVRITNGQPEPMPFTDDHVVAHHARWRCGQRVIFDCRDSHIPERSALNFEVLR
jgi:hypothetical protein